MASLASPDLLSVLKAAADPSRLRLLRLLDREELTVGESARCLDAQQSSVSRHVAVLRGVGLVEERSEGTRTYLRFAPPPAPDLRPLFEAVMELVRSDLPAEHDADLERLAALRRERDQARGDLFDELAGDWDALRTELFDGGLPPSQITSLLSPSGLRVVDAGAGTGALLPWLSTVVGPRGAVIAVEPSTGMRERALSRAGALANVEVRAGRMEDLPVEDDWADAVLLSLSLGHTRDVDGALGACRRVLRPGGRLAVADVERHDDAVLVSRLGRGFRGFEPEELLEALVRAGLQEVRRAEFPPPAGPSSRRSPGQVSKAGSRRARSLSIEPLRPLFVVGVEPEHTSPHRLRTRERTPAESVTPRR